MLPWAWQPWLHARGGQTGNNIHARVIKCPVSWQRTLAGPGVSRRLQYHVGFVHQSVPTIPLTTHLETNYSEKLSRNIVKIKLHCQTLFEISFLYLSLVFQKISFPDIYTNRNGAYKVANVPYTLGENYTPRHSTGFDMTCVRALVISR